MRLTARRSCTLSIALLVFVACNQLPLANAEESPPVLADATPNAGANAAENVPQEDPSTTAFHDEIVAILQDPRTELGGDYAGAWVDPRDRNKVIVAFKGDAADLAKKDPSKEKLTKDSRVKIEKKAFSQDDLARVLEKVMVKLNKLLADPPPVESWPFQTSIRNSHNTVDVLIDESASHRKEEIEAELSKEIADSTVRLAYHGDIQQQTYVNSCTSRTSCKPMRGGLDTDGCTSGFIFTNPTSFTKLNGEYAPKRTRWMSTGGHCLDRGQNLKSGGVTVGPVEYSNSVLTGNVDVSIADINYSDSNALPNNSIYRGPAGVPDTSSDRRVTSRIADPRATLESALLCQEGVDGEVSGHSTCGELTDWNASWGAQSGFGRAASMWGCHGDSGAPVVNATTDRAYGMVLGSPKSGECNNELTFTWTAYAEAKYGMDLMRFERLSFDEAWPIPVGDVRQPRW